MSIERLLDHFRIRKSWDSDRGRRRLNLHKRIELLRTNNAEVTELLLAAKWLGNDGTHEGMLSRADAVDALNLIEAVLLQLFDDSKKQLTALAKKINRRKGPARRRPKSEQADGAKPHS